MEDIRIEDFDRFRKELAKTRGLVSLGNEVQRIRTVFKYAYDADLIMTPIRFGPGFKRPSRRALRKDRRGKGVRMFEAQEIRAILESCDTHLRSMVLLGVNCGFGNNDCGTLTMNAIDLENSWVDFPRPKTANRCKR